MAVTTKIIVQQILNIDDTKATASKFPRYTVTLGNSISSITASELVSSIEAAAKSAAAAKDSEIAAKTSELNAKDSEQEAAISAGASEASATQSATSATQSAASADRSAASAAAAKVSETNAKASETKAKTSETNAKTSETNAKASETKAKASETNAKTSKTNAAASAAAAKISETNAKISETNAAESAADSKGFRDEAEAFAAQAAASAAAAKVSETKAKTSETNAKASETKAKASETNAASSATSASQSVTTIQGLKSDVETLKSDTQTIKDSAVAETTALKSDVEQLKIDTQTIKDNAVSETTALKDAAAASATKAGNSATEAGKQAGNAGASATAAKKDADRAKTEADRAEAAANNAPEIQPLPDVWIPFNDSLDMITGFAPGYKTITVGDDVVTMVSDKVVDFKRASGATYINKSGVLTIADIDEPRFEKEGLLIEGQRTNYLRNSNKTDSWTIHSSLNKTFGIDDRGFNYATVTPTENIVGTTGGYTIHGVVTEDRFPLATGDSFTFSCRVKGAKARCRLRVSTIIGGTDTFSADSYLDLDTLQVSVSGNTSLITAKAEQDGEWTYYQATYTAKTSIDSVNCTFYMANKVNNEPFYADSTLTMTTPQIELGNTASSFIITSMPSTRASDVVSIPSNNNIGSSPLSCLVEIHKDWDTVTPNAAPRVFDISGGAIAGQYMTFDFHNVALYPVIRFYNKDGSNKSVALPVFPKDASIGFVLTKSGNLHGVTNGNPGGTVSDLSWTGVKSGYLIRFGGQTSQGTSHLFGHIRNFRIWHKELTDRQMKESV